MQSQPPRSIDAPVSDEDESSILDHSKPRGPSRVPPASAAAETMSTPSLPVPTSAVTARERSVESQGIGLKDFATTTPHSTTIPTMMMPSASSTARGGEGPTTGQRPSSAERRSENAVDSSVATITTTAANAGDAGAERDSDHGSDVDDNNSDSEVFHPESTQTTPPPAQARAAPPEEDPKEGEAKRGTHPPHEDDASLTESERKERQFMATYRNVYFASLPFRFRVKELCELVRPFGEIDRARILERAPPSTMSQDPQQQTAERPAGQHSTRARGNGCGFVYFSTHEAAAAAVQALNGAIVEGRTIQVQPARTQPNRRR